MINNINILYEDTQILVCVKPAGVATQSKRIGSPDMVSLLKNHISMTSGKSGEPYLAVIHRLDQPVSGILVFAKIGRDRQFEGGSSRTWHGEDNAKAQDSHRC
mgnify:CR=1 FL=1